MPPKSAKKEKPVWWKCEQCQTFVLTSELSKHQADCRNLGALSGYITEAKVFHSTRFECASFGSIDELKDVSDTQQNRLILVGSAVMSRLDLILGDLVEVTLARSDSGFTCVRQIWPLDEKIGSRVSCANIDELKIPMDVGLHVSIKRFQKKIVNVEELELALTDDVHCGEEITKNEKAFLQLLQRQYLGRVLSERNVLRLRLCNKSYTFKVVKLRVREIAFQGLEDQMEGLTLQQDRYFQIDRDSKISIRNIQSVDESNVAKVAFDLNNIGGMKNIIDEMKDIAGIALGVTKQGMNVPISRGILVYGVSGVGKTLLVRSIAEYFHFPTITINCTEVFSKFYGETESNIKKLFDKAFNNYPNPTVVIVEEIHNICPKAESSDIVKRISHFFVNLLDSLHHSPKGRRTLVLCTTDNPDNLNPSLRRGGRIDYEFELPVPSADAREEILAKVMASYKHTLTPEEVRKIASITHGYVGADLVSLVARAMHEADAAIEYANMIGAMQHVKASAMREIMIECPNVRWSDIGGQDELKLQLRQIIDWPIHRPEIFSRLGITPPRGLLMFGPPGCSKTMIAKAIATESKVNFLSIKGSELFSMWVGESERAVRELFRKARQVAPSIIFFDEIDAIGGERSAESGSSVKERVLAQILTEIDGVSTLKNVKIVAATNRPDLIDKALMRPGRLDRIIYVRLPDAGTRREIFKIKLSKIPTAADVDIDGLVNRTEGYSGSEIEAICQEAVLKALENSFSTSEISQKYFDFALLVVKPRTTAELLQLYDNYLQQQQR